MAAELEYMSAHFSRAADLAQSRDQAAVQCLACAHRCVIPAGGAGVCNVRVNRAGVLRVPFGYTASLACDPIEKKPFFHVLPGAQALSFGMLGCNLRCPFCQNWTLSQAGRDPDAWVPPQPCAASELVQLALRRATPVLAGTYNEPLITSEWACDIFRLGKRHGMLTCYVSNGYATTEVLVYLDPWLDAVNVDLKCFSERGYARLGGRLQPVLDTIRALRQRGKWVEVTTLVVPEFNDSRAELNDIAGFLASVDVDMPWHVSAYHADYQMRHGPARTSRRQVETALESGAAAGLRYLYAGNLAGLDQYENTRCRQCGRLLIERHGFRTVRNELQGGCCPDCRLAVPGRWDRSPLADSDSAKSAR